MTRPEEGTEDQASLKMTVTEAGRGGGRPPDSRPQGDPGRGQSGQGQCGNQCRRKTRTHPPRASTPARTGCSTRRRMTNAATRTGGKGRPPTPRRQGNGGEESRPKGGPGPCRVPRVDADLHRRPTPAEEWGADLRGQAGPLRNRTAAQDQPATDAQGGGKTTTAEGEGAGGRAARHLPLQPGERHLTGDHGGPWRE